MSENKTNREIQLYVKEALDRRFALLESEANSAAIKFVRYKSEENRVNAESALSALDGASAMKICAMNALYNLHGEKLV